VEGMCLWDFALDIRFCMPYIFYMPDVSHLSNKLALSRPVFSRSMNILGKTPRFIFRSGPWRQNRALP
jgi:hypothetical protein